MAAYKSNLVDDGKGGKVHFPFTITQDHMDLIKKEFTLQNNDVFVVTFPRSGTTWTEQIVHLLMHNGEQGEKLLTEAAPWLETLPHRPNGMAKILQAMQGRRLFTSHLPYPLMPYKNDATAKYIYVARNPKDVAISFYFHDKSKVGYTGTWEEHFQRFMKGEITFGSYFDHVLPWWDASQRNENILFLKYEDMKNDHAGNVAKIASFLDIDADTQLIDRVVTASSFQAMKSHPMTNFNWIPQSDDAPKHFRKGKIGDWRNHFSEEQSQQLDDLYMQKMTGTGLQFDFGDGIILP